MMPRIELCILRAVGFIRSAKILGTKYGYDKRTVRKEQIRRFKLSFCSFFSLCYHFVWWIKINIVFISVVELKRRSQSWFQRGRTQELQHLLNVPNWHSQHDRRPCRRFLDATTTAVIAAAEAKTSSSSSAISSSHLCFSRFITWLLNIHFVEVDFDVRVWMGLQ